MTSLENNNGKKKIRFIINPISGVKKKSVVEKLILQELDKSAFEYEICYTKAAGHAIELSAEAAEKDFDFVVAVGGDGSLNEVAQSLVGKRTCLGIIPVGSGNGLAHYLKIPTNVSKAIKVINGRKTICVDTASISNLKFFSIAGVGFDAYIADLFSKCKKRGFWSYSKLVFREFLLFKPNRFRLYINGRVLHRRAMLISFANGNQYGYNAVISPKSIIDDGLIDVCIMRKPPIFLAPVLGICLFLRIIDKIGFVEIIRTSEVRIIQKKNYIAHVDGDKYRLSKELLVKVHPKSLNVIIP